MIPGDIDLTENLDFRKVVRREIPQLPTTWNGEDSSNTIKINYTTDNTGSIYLSNNIYWHNDMYIGEWNTINIDDLYYEPTIYNTSSSIRLTNFWRNNIDDYNTFRVWNSITNDEYFDISYSSNSNKSIYKTRMSYSGEPERDIFGNVKSKYDEYIPDIPWSLSNRKSIIKPIPWKSNYDFLRYDDVDDDIPEIAWDYRPKRKYNPQYDETNVFHRAKHLISWFEGKTESFIRRYLSFREEDYSSYLTNMSWIRIRNAIID